MNAEEYLKQELSKRELWDTETDDCYQVLAEIMKDYTQSHITKLEARNKELEEALHKIQALNPRNAPDFTFLSEAKEIAEQALNKK